MPKYAPEKSSLLPWGGHISSVKIKEILATVYQKICTIIFVMPKPRNNQTFINRRTHTLCYIHPWNITQQRKLMTYIYTRYQ